MTHCSHRSLLFYPRFPPLTSQTRHISDENMQTRKLPFAKKISLAQSNPKLVQQTSLSNSNPPLLIGTPKGVLWSSHVFDRNKSISLLLASDKSSDICALPMSDLLRGKNMRNERMLILVKFVLLREHLTPGCSGRTVPVERGVCLDTKHVLREGHGDLQGLQEGQNTNFR